MKRILLLLSFAMFMASTPANAQALINAALLGDGVTAEKLIQAGANINQTDINGNTPLILASECGYLSLAKLLVKHRANINIKSLNGSTALIMSSKMGYIDIVNLLLANNAITGIRDQNTLRAIDYAVEGDSIKKILSMANPEAKINLFGVWHALRGGR